MKMQQLTEQLYIASQIGPGGHRRNCGGGRARYHLQPPGRRGRRSARVSRSRRRGVARRAGSAAGISVAASRLARNPALDIAIIDPADVRYYQPGWTLVGGVFQPAQTARVMGALIPRGVRWIKAAVSGFVPEHNVVLLEGCRTVRYGQLVVCPGLKLNRDGIAGLCDTLGRHGVTSNYRYDLAAQGALAAASLPAGHAQGTRVAGPT